MTRLLYSLLLLLLTWSGNAQAQAGYTTYCWIVSTLPTQTVGLYKPVLCDTSGRLFVTPGTSPWLDGGTVVNAPPSVSAGTTSALNLNTSGELLVAAYQAGTWALTPTTTTSSPTNSSAVIVTGNTFQQVLTANTSRLALTISNNNASDDCWIYLGAAGSATKAAAILLAAKALVQWNTLIIPSSAVQATCATSSDTLYIDTQ